MDRLVFIAAVAIEVALLKILLCPSAKMRVPAPIPGQAARQPNPLQQTFATKSASSRFAVAL
jgi:hypothetical protein